MKYIKTKMNYIENDKRGDCVCGHNHIVLVGDLGINHNEMGFDLITDCCECECESFERRRNKK